MAGALAGAMTGALAGALAGAGRIGVQRELGEQTTQTLPKPQEAQIKTCAITGLVVDIRGTAPAKADAAVRCVALRSDLDALTMTEGNNGLPYRSKNQGVAHMCGHDGHIAALVGAAILLQRRADRLPSNLTVRLLFQPAEALGAPMGLSSGGGPALHPSPHKLGLKAMPQPRAIHLLRVPST